MSPFTFLSQPSIWIHCMSKYKCNSTGAPNFAFELVVGKWREPKDGHQVDLSQITYIGNGAEPVRLETIDKFYSVFQEYGLNHGVVHPQCGLAETCVFATVDHSIFTILDSKGIRRVCCGNVDAVQIKFDVDIRITNPVTGEELKDNEEGEIIISSQSIAAGYMNRPELSKEVFEFQLPNNNNSSRTYLRTGDLGMIVKPDREWSIANPDRHPIYGQDDALLEEELNQRHLVITGRIKDLIILNGRNYYPQDIELCVEHALTDERLVRSGCVVATSIEWNNEESFGIVCELREMELKKHIGERIKKNKLLTKELILKEICIKMIKEIHVEFGIKPSIVALIKEKTISKTTSGKVRRKATAAALLAGDQLKVIYQYESEQEEKHWIETAVSSLKVQNVDDIKQIITNILGEMLYADLNKDDLNDNTNLSELGVSSMNLIQFHEYIEQAFDIQLDTTIAYSYPTIQELSKYIAAKQVGIEDIMHDNRSHSVNSSRLKVGFLSAAQKQIVIHSNFNTNSAIYNIFAIWKHDNSINVPQFVNAVKVIIMKHDALRTRFDKLSSSNELLQSVHDSIESNKWFHHIKAREVDMNIMLQTLKKPFDLKRDALFRFVLSDSLLGFVIHHSIADGVSVQIILSELSQAYKLNGKFEISNGPVLQSINFALWESNRANTNDYMFALKFWSEQALLAIRKPFILQNSFPQYRVDNNQKQTYATYRITHQDIIFESFEQHQTFTTFELLFGSFQLFLHLLTDEDIISINTVYTNRPKEFWKTVGMFANTVIYSTNFTRESHHQVTILDIFKCIKETLSEGSKHSWLSLSAVYDHLRSNNHTIPVNGLSNILFVFQTTLISSNSLDVGNDIQLIEYSSGNPQPFIFEIIDKPDSTFDTIIHYDTECFAQSEIEKMGEKWNHLLQQIFVNTSNLEIPINNVSLLSQSDIELINSSNDTYIEWDNNNNNGTVIDLIIEQSKLYPNKVALHMNDDTLTYKELINACYILSKQLCDEYNIKIGDVICVCMNRSFEMIISIISIMMCGGIYCPIHPSEAIKRCKRILKRVDYKLVLCDNKTENMFENFKYYSYTLNKDIQKFVKKSTLCNNKEVAYCIFTSGSTGEPKGVLSTHDALFNVCNSLISNRAINQNDICLQLSRCTFDVHITDIFASLSAGSTLVLFGEEVHLNFDAMQQLITQHSITCLLCITPTYALRFFNSLPSSIVFTCLRRVGLGGEPSNQIIIDSIRKHTRVDVELVIVYGPCETTIMSSEQLVPINNSVLSVGTPFPNYLYFVLNNQKQLVIPGQIGELYIAGRGLMNGYINQPELTAERLVNITLPTSIHSNGELLAYRTGDLVYQMNDGNLVIVGRVDHQIKIRGQRVELGEIESVLKLHDMIKDIVVVGIKDDKINDTQLVAYVTLNNNLIDKEENKSEEQEYYKLNDKYTNILSEYCHNQLPIHMHPSIYIVMKELPLNQNIKIDRKQLPSLLDIRNNEIEDTVELNNIELQIAEIWSKVLNIDINSIKRTSNFFHLGGSSLSAAQLISILRNKYSDEFSIQLIFEHPILTDLCTYIDTKSAVNSTVNNNELNADSKDEATPHMCKYHLDHQPTLGERLSNSLRFTVQSIWILFVLCYLGISMLLPMFIIRESINHYGTDNLALIFLLFYLAVICIGLEIVILILFSKWLLVSNIKVGTYHMWSKPMLKWWCFHSLLKAFHPLISFFLLETRWIIYWYKLLGANIGNNCVIKTSEILDPYMINVGDNCVINHNVQLLGHRFYIINEIVVLEINNIDIEDDCYIEDRCIIECGISMKIGGELAAGSVLLYGQIIPSNSAYDGNPAVFIRQSDNKLQYYRDTVNNYMVSIMQLVFCGILVITILISFTFSLWIGYNIYEQTSRLYAIWFIIGVGPYLIACLICISIICLRWIIMNVQHIESRQTLTKRIFLKRWFVGRLVNLLSILAPFVGGLTFISQLLYYCMGLHTDIFNSQVTSIDIGEDIDLLHIKKGVWCGHNLTTVCSYYSNDKIICKEVNIDNGCVFGENVMLLPGSSISSYATIGANTTINKDMKIKSGGIYVGNTEIPTNYNNDNSELEIPSLPLKVHLYSILLHIIGILLFSMTVLPIAYLFNEYIYNDYDWTIKKDPYFWILLPITSWRCVFIGISGLFISLLNTFIISCIDRLLLQPLMKDGVQLFSISGLLWQWSAFLKAFTLLNPSLHNRFLLGGTHYIIGILKLFGSKISWNVYMNNVIVNETDKLNIGNNSVIEGALLLAHTVEQHLLKQNDIMIGNNGCIKPMSRIMPGAVIEDTVEILPLTLIMKNETLNKNMSVYSSPSVSTRRLLSNNKLNNSLDLAEIQHLYDEY